MPAGPFHYIEKEFETELEASRIGRRFREWKKQHPVLQRFEDIDALIAFQWDESIPSAQSNEVTFLLCELAAEDPAAKLLLLRLYVPGLTKRWSSLSKGVLPRDEVASELVTGFLIRATKLERGAENLSNRLLGAAADRVQDAIEKRLTELAHEFAAADARELAAGKRGATDAVEEVLAGAGGSDLLRRAVAEGIIQEKYARLLWAKEVDSLTTEEAGQLVGLEPSAAGVALHRTKARLRNWRGKDPSR